MSTTVEAVLNIIAAVTVGLSPRYKELRNFQEGGNGFLAEPGDGNKFRPGQH
jgi:hypothetical protein